MGSDPLFSHGITLAVFLIVIIKVIVAFAVLLVSVLLMIWFERKLISDMQNRIGPNRAGPFGILQTLADGTKLFFKEDLIPDSADRTVFKLAPFLSVVPAFLVFSIVPIGGVVHIFGHTTELQVADPPMGILFMLVMSSISVYGVTLAGWSSGSKYPLLGSVRATAQMISYEAAMGLSIASVVLITGSLSTRDIVTSQFGTFLGFIPKWNLIRLGIVPFLVFLVAITAEMNRPPFDLAEAESELVGGFHTEYSSLRFALFYLAEFMNTVTMSAIIVTLFFGGASGPVLFGPSWIWPIIWFLIKTGVFLFFYVWVRAALPRLRYDQLMTLGWKILIPVALAWFLIVAAMQVNSYLGFGVFILVLISGGLLSRASGVGDLSDPFRLGRSRSAGTKGVE
ncbi:MAG: NADH-quinone oxidoreductase subunit NuoH [Actinomycetota bacterium]|nr:MAG: NADH-quinone oxidoreductase subunit NuoH [Actinomycetota bacterium]